MANKLLLLKKDLFAVIKANPIEILSGLTFFLLATLDESNHTRFIDSYHILFLFPFFFFLSFIANRTLKVHPLRGLYFLSYLCFVPFLFLDIYDFIPSSAYFYTLLITFILFISYTFKKDNALFSREALRNVLNLLSAIFIALAFYLIVIGIYASGVYIFNIISDYKFYLYAFYLTLFFIIPLSLLYFDRFTQNSKYEASNLSQVLLNFIISPALIIYTVILYIYFAKILIVRELPRGNVAYMVFGFILFVMIGKICQELLPKRMYDWFYNKFSLISLPILSMFWFGVGYRIHEYGITENRIYLVIAGIIITLFVILFLFSRTAHYVYISTTALILYAVFTFIPGISARDLDDKYRNERPISYESSSYYYKSSYSTERLYFYSGRWSEGIEKPLDISKYKKLYQVENKSLFIDGKKQRYEFNEQTGVLFLASKTDTIFSVNMNHKLQQMAAVHGIKLTKRTEEKDLYPYIGGELMTLETDKALIKLNKCILRYANDSIYKVDEVTIDLLLLR